MHHPTETAADAATRQARADASTRPPFWPFAPLEPQQLRSIERQLQAYRGNALAQFRGRS